MHRLIASLLLACFTWNAQAAISLALAPNYDDTRTTEYPNGDKPVSSCVSPNDWTEANTGDGFGEFCEQSSSEFDASVGGSSSIQKMHYAYKAIAGSGDVQIKGRITDEYTGSTDSLASLGFGFRDGGGDTDFFAQCFAPQSTGFRAQCNYGTAANSFTNVNGAAGTRPVYICLAFDDSSGDVKGFGSDDGSSWLEIFTTNHDFSGGRVYFFGSSRSATETLQGTIDNLSYGTTIDCYTPSDPPGGSPPVLTSNIPNQTGTQGTAFSLTFSSFFTGATSHSVVGLPGSSGLSESSDGVLSGTPASADVSASPYNLDLCATNADGTTCDSVQFTFSAPSGSGDVFTVPDVADVKSTFTCNTTGGANGASWASVRTSGSGTTVGPGDVIEITSGSRGAVEFRNCNGAAGNPITIRKTASATRLTITGAGGGADAFLLRDSSYVHVNGLVNWTGHGGGCGVDDDMSGTPLTDCGILIDATNQFLVKMRGSARFLTFEGIEADGNWTGSGSGQADVAISPNDQSFCTPNSNPEYREGLVIRRNYLHDVNGEIMYFGPNVNYGNCGTGEGVPRLRDNELAYNFISGGGWDGIEVKSCNDPDRPCLIHHNRVENTGGGVAGSGANSIGISCFEGSCDIYHNIVDTTSAPPGGAPGIACGTNNAPSSWGPLTCNIYGNVIFDTDGPGINRPKGANSNADTAGDIYNNTVVDVGGTCINISSSNDGPGGVIRNNICAGSTSINTGGSGTGYSQSNNRTGSVASQNFTNAAGDDYSLTSSSPARNPTGVTITNCPSDDLLGTSRPKGGECDQGAYEFDE